MTFYQQNIDFAIGRHKDAVRVGERRARWHANVGLVPSASEGWVRETAHLLSAGWASVQQHLRRSVTGPAQSGQPAG